jgi:hypothetical protein
MAIKIFIRMQILLRPENLNPRIVANLNLDPIVDLALISVAKGAHDLINDILQANRTSAKLELLRQRAIDKDLGWTVRNDLLFFED